MRYVGNRNNEWILGIPCIFGFMLNALLIGIFMKTGGSNKRLSGYGSPVTPPAGQESRRVPDR